MTELMRGHVDADPIGEYAPDLLRHDGLGADRNWPAPSNITNASSPTITHKAHSGGSPIICLWPGG
jgi:hypothetical protein